MNLQNVSYSLLLLFLLLFLVLVCFSLFSAIEKQLNFFGKSEDKFDNAIGALIKILIDTKKAKLTDKAFKAFLNQETEFTDDQIDVFWKFLNNNCDQFLHSNELRFRDLQWRLDAKVQFYNQ